MSLWLLFVLMTLATYRVTRLLVVDSFPPVMWARDRLVGGWRPVRDHEHELATQVVDGHVSLHVKRASWVPWWLAELVSCPWCVSAYVAAVVVGVVYVSVGVPLPWLVWLAVWGAGALLTSQDWA